MQHYIYAAIIFVCGFINHHYKSVAYSLAKEATIDAIKQLTNGKLQELIDQFKKDFENVDKENVKNYHVPDFDVSTPMPKVKPPKQEENEDLSVDTKDKK